MITFKFMNYEEIQEEIDRSLGEDQPDMCGDVESSFGVKSLLVWTSAHEKIFVTEMTGENANAEDAYGDLTHPIAGFIIHTETSGATHNEEFNDPNSLMEAWASYEREFEALEVEPV